MHRRRMWWLVAAALLIGAGAWLMSLADRNTAKSRVGQVKMPRSMDSEAWSRMQARRLPVWNTVDADAPNEDEKARPRSSDPLLAIMPERIKRMAVVLEANAVLNSPLGKMLLNCLAAGNGNNALTKAEKDWGLHLERDLDRVAMIDDTVVMSGFFENAKWDAQFAEFPREVLGTKGKLWRQPDGGAIVAWDNHLLLQARDETDARAMVARLQNHNASVENPVLTETQTYGEIYGVLGPEVFANLFGDEIPNVKERISAFADRVELHVDTTSDVGIVADVQGKKGAPGGDDLGRTIGGLLSLGRMKARLDDEKELAEILDLARVKIGDNGFRTEMAMPLTVIEKILGQCAKGATDAGSP